MGAKTDIKFFVHTNNNAPQLQNAFGSMINVLDAALINGIQVGTVSSLTASGKMVTAVFGTAHNLMLCQVIKIAGANQAEYNGEHRILSVPNATTLTFELAEVPSTTIATGTINCSLPPLGWEKPFSSSNPNGGGKAAYRSKNLLLPSRPFLRVVDELDPVYTATYAKYAKVGIVEEMTDIDTMLGVQAPFDSANPTKNWVGTGAGVNAFNGWAKWYYATSASTSNATWDNNALAAGNRSWLLIGTRDHFYILPETFSAASKDALVYGFGSFESFVQTDQANNFLSATTAYHSAGALTYKSQTTPLTSSSSNTSTYDCLQLQRKYTKEGISNTAGVTGLLLQTQIDTGGGNYIATPAQSGMILQTDILIKELGAIIRGRMPLLAFLYNKKPYSDLQFFEKNGFIYIAKDVGVNNTSGQIAIKVGVL